MRTGAEVRTATRWAAQHGIARVVVGRAAKRGDLQARLVADGGRTDPYPLHAELRARGHLVAGAISAVTASHGVTAEVLRSNDFGVQRDLRDVPGPVRAALRWSSRGAPLHPLEQPSLLAVDDPEHRRYRRLVSSVFTARAVARMAEEVQGVADRLLDDLATAGPTSRVDLVERYASRLPLEVIAEMLGVGAHDHALVLRLGTQIAASLDVGVPFTEFRTVSAGLREFDTWIGTHLQHLRTHPGDDLLSQLVAGGQDGEQLTEQELRSTAGLLLAAGFETTVNLLGSGIRLLQEHPDQLERLRADPSWWPTAVDELLRLESPVQVTSRSALRDTEVTGLPVAAGTRIVMFLGGANRDPEVFPDPDTLDVTRANAGQHVAFAGGRHFCLGAALARMEGEIGLRTLLQRFPHLTLLDGAQRQPTRVLRGWRTLPATLGPSS